MNSMKINRETYKKIKKMDHKEMESYLVNIQTLAYNQGISDITQSLADKIVKGLESTKGIGEKRMADIIDNINRAIAES